MIYCGNALTKPEQPNPLFIVLILSIIALFGIADVMLTGGN